MKKRIISTAIVALLVVALVLTIVATSKDKTNDYVVPTPTVTTAPVATETPVTTQTPVVTEAPSVLVDADEEQLATYGITFPEFEDIEYSVSDYEYDMVESMSFGADIDMANEYQIAYTFEIDASITAVDHNGDSLSKSKMAPSLEYDYTELGYFPANAIDDWAGTSRYYFTVGKAGIYTVTYTIKVEHDKDDTYGYYAPGELEEEYTIVKTYTVAKAELNLETKSDAFQVEDSMFFVNSDIVNGPELKTESDGDYYATVNVTICEGTEVGEYPLEITIYDEDDNEVNASEVILDNYYVTTTEGTRYIVSEDDVAKANAIRQMVAADLMANIYTTEYSAETIIYYNALTDAQKQMASVAGSADEDYNETQWNKYYEGVLVDYRSVSQDQMDEATYNMERDYMVGDIEDLLDAYMKAATTNNKNAALDAIVDALLALDNTAHEYGSDQLYVLKGLTTRYYDDDGYTFIDFEGTLNFEDEDSTLYAVSKKNASEEYIDFITYSVAYDSEADGYKATFGYIDNESEETFVVDEKFSEALANYYYNLMLTSECYAQMLESDMITQEMVDIMLDGSEEYAYGDYEFKGYNGLSEYWDNLYDFQRETAMGTDVTFEDIYEMYLELFDDFLARWDAYIAIIEEYEFESSYIDNADRENLGATYSAMYSLFGYTFENGELAAIVAPYAVYYDETGDKAVYYYNINDGKFETDIAIDYSNYEYYLGGADNSGSYSATEFMLVEGTIEKSLATAMFGNDDIVASEDDVLYVYMNYNTPEIFLDGVLQATCDYADIYIDVQSEVDAVKTDLIQYVVATGEYTRIYADGEITESLNAPFESVKEVLVSADVENATIAIEYIDIENALFLEDLNIYIDAYIANQLLDEDSDFYDELDKNGYQSAETEMFEFVEDIYERIDDMVDLIDAEKEAEISKGASDNQYNATFGSITFDGITIDSGNFNVVGGSVEAVAVIGGADEADVLTDTVTLEKDGDYLKITADVIFGGDYAFIGTQTITATVYYAEP